MRLTTLLLFILLYTPVQAQSTCEKGYRCFREGNVEECKPSRECDSGYARENERRPEDYDRNKEQFPGYHEPGERRFSPQYYDRDGD